MSAPCYALYFCPTCEQTVSAEDNDIEWKMGLPFCKFCNTGPMHFDGWDFKEAKSATDPEAMYCGACAAVIPTDTVKCSECGDEFRRPGGAA